MHDMTVTLRARMQPADAATRHHSAADAFRRRGLLVEAERESCFVDETQLLLTLLISLGPRSVDDGVSDEPGRLELRDDDRVHLLAGAAVPPLAAMQERWAVSSTSRPQAVTPSGVSRPVRSRRGRGRG